MKGICDGDTQTALCKVIGWGKANQRNQAKVSEWSLLQLLSNCVVHADEDGCIVYQNLNKRNFNIEFHLLKLFRNLFFAHFFSACFHYNEFLLFGGVFFLYIYFSVAFQRLKSLLIPSKIPITLSNPMPNYQSPKRARNVQVDRPLLRGGDIIAVNSLLASYSTLRQTLKIPDSLQSC